MSKSIPWGNPGNFNMKGKKVLPYTDDEIKDLREKLLEKTLRKEIKEEIWGVNRTGEPASS